jgi:hypothetical protein
LFAFPIDVQELKFQKKMLVVIRSVQAVLIKPGPIMHQFELHMHGEQPNLLPTRNSGDAELVAF